jgi:hypothetical protein
MIRATLSALCLLVVLPVHAQDLKECIPFNAGIKNVRVTSAVPQEDIQKSTMAFIRTTVVHTGPASPTTAGIIGGIIGGLIADAFVNSQIKKRIEEATLALPILLEQTRDLDVREYFWDRLDGAIHRPGRLNPLDLTLFKSERGYFQAGEELHGAKVEGVLDLQTQYALTADLHAFTMITDARLQNKGGTDVYRCRFVFTTPPISVQAVTPEEAARLWAANEAAAYRAAVALGVSQTLKMLRYDLLDAEAPRAAGAEIKISERRTMNAVVVQVPVPATQIERDGAVMIGRDDKGILRSSIDTPLFTPTSVAAATPDAPRRQNAPDGPTKIEDLDALLSTTSRPASSRREAEEPVAPRRPQPAPRGVQLDDLKDLLQPSR